MHPLLATLTPQQQILGAAIVALPATLGAMHLALRFLPLLGAATRGLLNRRHKQKQSITVGPIKLTDDARMRHTHIIGATGTGKTVLLEHLLYRDLARGYGALIIDPKGERAFYDRVREYCSKIGRLSDLSLLSATYPEESVRWNPCRLGSISELQSKFFCSSKYENSFYAKACELALLEVFEKTQDTNPLTLLDITHALKELSQRSRDEHLKGLYFDLENLSRGEWGAILGTQSKDGNDREVSLLDVVRRNEILFVDLPTEGKSVQSSRLGALLLQEICLLSGIRKRMPESAGRQPYSIFVDEFDAFATEPFVTFLNKGRSSGFMIHLAHQTLSDLKRVSPTFLGQVVGNINNRFIFRLDLAEDAEQISKLFGTKTVIRKTHQTMDGQATGVSSNREAQEFEIHPDRIKSLKVGSCIFSIKTEGKLSEVQIPPLTPATVPNLRTPINRKPMDLTEFVHTESTGAALVDSVDFNQLMEMKGTIE